MYLTSSRGASKPGRKKPMNGLELDECMEAGNRVDPKRGPKWVRVFQARARSLGFVFRSDSPCTCGMAGRCRPECGFTRPPPELVLRKPKTFA